MSNDIRKQNVNENLKKSLVNNSVLLTSDKEDKHLSNIISFVVFSMFIHTMLARLNEGLGFNSSLNSTVSNILKLILGVVFLTSIKIILTRLNIRIIMFIILSNIVIVLNVLFFPENNQHFFSFVVYFYITILPLFIYTILIRDYRYLLDSLTKTSYIISVISIIFFVYSYVGLGVNFNYRSYSMSFSYGILLPSMFLVREFIATKKLWGLFLAAGLITLIIVYGSRGPLLCLLTYIFIILFRKYTYYEGRKYKLILLVIMTLGFFTLAPYLVESFSTILDNLNINSRVINLFLQDSVEMSGREIIYRTILSEFLEAPLTIRGINADFILVGTYAHNLFLELLYQLGIILGSLIIVLILFFSFKTIFSEDTTPYSDCRTILFSVALPQLMISGSLWSSMYFWMWISLMLKKTCEKNMYKY